MILCHSVFLEGYPAISVDKRILDGLAFGSLRHPLADPWCEEDRVTCLLVESDHRSSLAKVDNLLAKCKVCHVRLLSAAAAAGGR